MHILKGTRQKRFRFVSNPAVKFVLETKTGARLTLVPENCSITGIGARLVGELPQNEGLDVGEIIPLAKLSWTGHEYALGRLVVCVVRGEEGGTYLGFSAIDSKLPIEGDLTQFFTAEQLDQNPYEYELSADKFSLADFTQGAQENSDLFAKCRQFAFYFKEWEKTPRYLYRTVREPSMGNRVKLTKKRKGGRNDYIIMGSNDYLGLSAHPEVMKAAKDAIDQYGFGSTGSPMTTGNAVVHEELCDFIGDMLDKESVLLFNSGYAVNVGVVTGMTSEKDLIVADILSHASLQDGMQMSKATSRYFKHNDVAHLEKILKEHRESHAGGLVITEGVFSMDGDVPPLDKIVEMAKKHKCRTLVDEAHSFGVIGPNGLGACEKYDLLSDVDMIMGTFSKICGGIGGFIAGSKEGMDWVYWTARSRIFSVSIPPSTAAAALKSLEIFTRDQSIVQQLNTNIKHFVGGMRELGAKLDPNHQSAVVPVVIGDEKKLGLMNKVLLDAGVFVVPVVFPAVSRTRCRFRFTVMATHTVAELDFVIQSFAMAMKEAGFTFESVEGGENLRSAA